MHVLVSGGTGLIGGALVRKLLAGDDEVTVLSRRREAAGEIPEGASLHVWDSRSPEGLEEPLKSADAVVHLAGESIASGRWTEERKERIRRSRVESTRAFTQAIGAASKRPEVFLQASAVGYYGPRGDEVVTEETPPGDDFLARVAVEWEEASAPLDSLEVRRPVARTGLVLSSEDGALPRMVLPFKLLLGGRLGNGRQWMPWIHVRDEVGALHFLLRHQEASGPFNLTAPEPVRNRDFVQALGDVLSRPTLLPAPAFGLKLLLGEMATLLLDGQRAVPERLLELGYEFRFTEAYEALEDLLA